MSHSINAQKNKQQNYPKVDFHQYLNSLDEPADDVSHDMPRELEAELLQNSFSMKRRFRQYALRMRSFYP